MGIRNTKAYSACVFDELKYYPAGEEYVLPLCDRYYYLWQSHAIAKDHLGSIRQTVDETGVIVAAQDYYAYGEFLRSVNNASELDKYKFTEKERNTETELDYGVYSGSTGSARYYNSALGMWLSVDPMADKYPGWSPYNYCANIPTKYVDPNGKDIKMPTDPTILKAMMIAYRTSPTYRDLHNKVLSNQNQMWRLTGNGQIEPRAYTESKYNQNTNYKVITKTVVNTNSFTKIHKGGSEAVATMANEITHVNEQSRFNSKNESDQYYDKNNGKGIPNSDGVCTQVAIDNEEAAKSEYSDSEEITKEQISDEELIKIMFTPNDEIKNRMNEGYIPDKVINKFKHFL